MTVEISWHEYKYFPYEKGLAIREIESLLAPARIEESKDGVKVFGAKNTDRARRLAYSALIHEGSNSTPTIQALIENTNGLSSKRQSTRYSSHGLHEYKGKFNPQIAKSLFNIYGPKRGGWILDPFCGSGTSLVEASHLGLHSVGTDLNPLAVFMANAKIASLHASPEQLCLSAERVLVSMKKSTHEQPALDMRQSYLEAWFPEDVLRTIERLKTTIDCETQPYRDILLAIASDQLRDYSLQEPRDLRIRRRISPFPERPFLESFSNAVNIFAQKLTHAQKAGVTTQAYAEAFVLDCRDSLESLKGLPPDGFDMAITSPPYATALPYIDTQRLSLVWLGLLAPSEISNLESKLVGSREIRGKGKHSLLEALKTNYAHLPEREASLCVALQEALCEDDGFRKQAVPRLLYRYFASMADSFESVKKIINPEGKYALVVGGNHTVLGGKRFDINTPEHLIGLAKSRGWKHLETIELQTYKRYGLHAKNSSNVEALIVLQS